MDEKKIETMMNRFDDMFLQHVSWMSEEKKKEILIEKVNKSERDIYIRDKSGPCVAKA